MTTEAAWGCEILPQTTLTVAHHYSHVSIINSCLTVLINQIMRHYGYCVLNIKYCMYNGICVITIIVVRCCVLE
jgi:hypothetical protein